MIESEIKLEETTISEYDDGSKDYRMDTVWYVFYNLKPPVGNNSLFNLLFQVAKLILIMPHSNAWIERVYSLANNNKRQGTERNHLDIEGLLSSILVVKLDTPESKFACYNYLPDDSLLASAKKDFRTFLLKDSVKIHELYSCSCI